MSNKVRVGDIVYYFQNLNDHAPKAAIVTAVYSTDHVSMFVFEGASYSYKQTVHNKHSQAIVNSTKMAMDFGVWDFREPPEIRQAMDELIASCVPAPKKAEAKQAAKV